MSHDDQILQLHQERKRRTSVSSEYDDCRNVPGSAAHNALLALSSIATNASLPSIRTKPTRDQEDAWTEIAQLSNSILNKSNDRHTALQQTEYFELYNMGVCLLKAIHVLNPAGDKSAASKESVPLPTFANIRSATETPLQPFHSLVPMLDSNQRKKQFDDPAFQAAKKRSAPGRPRKAKPAAKKKRGAPTKKIQIPAGQRCQMCDTTKTPEWRKGPDGTHCLCNACGLRWARQSKKMEKTKRLKNESVKVVPPTKLKDERTRRTSTSRRSPSPSRTTATANNADQTFAPLSHSLNSLMSDLKHTKAGDVAKKVVPNNN